jgi:uncharacterized protein YybS (DUF2232 family)
VTTKTWQLVLWGFLYAVLLLSAVTPFLVLTFSFLMLPMTIIYVKTNTRGFITAYLAALIPTTLITSFAGWTLPIISLIFLIPAVVMGRLYKKKAEAKLVIIAGMLTVIGELLSVFLLISAAGFNIQHSLTNSLLHSYETMPSLWQTGSNEEMMLNMVEYMVRMIPFFIALFAGYLVMVNHAMSRFVLKQTGNPVPGLKPLRNWMVPRSFVWYYILSMLFSMFLSEQSDSYWSTLLWNIVPILTVVFAIQGIGFLFYFTYTKRWNVALPVIGIVIALFLPYVVSLLGVLDRTLNIRKTIKKP